jgi:hypothetical protein
MDLSKAWAASWFDIDQFKSRFNRPTQYFLRIFSAYIQSTCAKRAKSARMENGQPRFTELPAEARRLYACIHIDPEEAEFRAA